MTGRRTKTMQDFKHFDYVITPSGLIKALETGQDISVIINGEYYELKGDKGEYVGHYKGYTVNNTWQGYEIQNGKYYLESIYKGIPKYTTDYLYSKKYKTLQSALKTITELERSKT